MLVAFYMPRTCTLLSALSHSAFIVTLSLSPSPQWSKAVPPPPLTTTGHVSAWRCCAAPVGICTVLYGMHAVTPLNPAQPDDASFVRFGPHHACQLPRGRRRTTVPPPCVHRVVVDDSLKLYYYRTRLILLCLARALAMALS